MLKGVNLAELVGFLKYPQLKETRNGNYLFQGKMAIPSEYIDYQTGEKKESVNYVKISAWGDVARELAGLAEDTPVRVQGHVNERSYDSNCKTCGSPEKKYWTDVQVNNFVVVS